MNLIPVIRAAGHLHRHVLAKGHQRRLLRRRLRTWRRTANTCRRSQRRLRLLLLRRRLLAWEPALLELHLQQEYKLSRGMLLGRPMWC